VACPPPSSPRRALGRSELGGQILSLKVRAVQRGPQATKAVWQLAGAPANEVEGVHLRSIRDGPPSACISSQCGCALRCAFCATGAMGLKGNLTADEITDQVLYWQQQGLAVGSVSFMGMGEPLMNPRVFDALRMLTHANLFGFSPRRLNVSTVGIVPAMHKLTEQFPQVNLALSVHSPFEEERVGLMPITRQYPLAASMAALADHVHATRRKVFMGYLLLEGVNNSPAHARALVGLVAAQPREIRHLFHVNLMRYNATDSGFTRATASSMKAFQDVLRQASVPSTVRHSPGEEIQAACGQLLVDHPATPRRPPPSPAPPEGATLRAGATAS
jgi:23S rRNA (adenine-C8)-methyltransferase